VLESSVLLIVLGEIKKVSGSIPNNHLSSLFYQTERIDNNMKSNIIDTINKAKKEYESTNKQLYSQKIRELAYEYMSKNNADTLNIKNGKHTISFHKGNPDTPNSITVIIDNKFYSCNLMDAILAALNPSFGSTATSTLSPCA